MGYTVYRLPTKRHGWGATYLHQGRAAGFYETRRELDRRGQLRNRDLSARRLLKAANRERIGDWKATSCGIAGQ